MSLWTGHDAGVTGNFVQHHESVNGTSHKRDRLRPMASFPLVEYSARVWRLARTEIVALCALLVVAMGTMTFVDLAHDLTEADARAFDQAVLLALRPGGSADGWGPGGSRPPPLI